jgi:integrase
MGETNGRTKLTDGVVADAVCPPGRKDVMLFDAELRGFGVRVTAAGGRIFFLQYKLAGRGRRATIGAFGELTTAQARKKAEALRGQVRDHRDPVAERRARAEAARATEAQAKAEAARAAFTVETLIDQWRDHHLSERSESYRRRVPREMKAALKRWLTAPAASLGQEDAVRVLDAAKTDRGPVAANRLQAVCRACWGWAVKRGSLSANPWQATPRPARERSRERVLSDAELAVIWKTATALDAPWNAIVPLMILTGQRRQEVAGLAWTELDLERGAWHLPAERAKNGRAHTVPLVPAAAALLRVRKRSGALVFENSRKTAPSGFGKVAARLVKATKAAGHAEPWTLHDIRRTVATGLQRLGVRLEVTEALLNHVSGSRAGIVGVYQRHGWEMEKRAALEAWTSHVLRLVDTTAEPPKVADLTAERSRRKGAG